MKQINLTIIRPGENVRGLREEKLYLELTDETIRRIIHNEDKFIDWILHEVSLALTIKKLI
jgi:hypothetical protein